MSSVYAPAPLRAATAASGASLLPTPLAGPLFSRFPTFAVGCGLISIEKTHAATDPAGLRVSIHRDAASCIDSQSITASPGCIELELNGTSSPSSDIHLAVPLAEVSSFGAMMYHVVPTNINPTYDSPSM
ncbi:hypothetical protein DFH08DRAFT_960559 [Mycena albidolilacea]|uniref:Uncharacterized protein n=1 Tax=Mycena albidolilacea TaxID=1033008 RepID=A0AAD7A0R7_9AGAR|nr:hypothetical protein DFH08DRAFT_960559 [Mycena albidolilacea]